MLNLGIIGCGNIVGMHVRHLDRTPVRATCVMDVDAGRAEAMAARLGCDWTTDRAALLARADVEAVLIATPNIDHAESALAALAAGKHVLCEKPIVTTLNEGVAVVRAARQAGVVFQSAFMRRCHPAYRELRRLVREEAGEVQHVRIRNSGGVPAAKWLEIQNDATYVRLMVSNLVTSGCHSLDVMRWVLGEPRAVFGKTRSWGDLPYEGFTTAAFDYGGFMAHWDYGLHRVRGVGDWRTGWEDTWEVTAEHARISLSMPDWDRYEENRPILRVHWEDGRVEEPALPPCDYYEVQLNDFAANVAAGTADPNAEDGYRAQALVEAIRASTRGGHAETVAPYYALLDA
jgi:predicted dehydrogenase